MFGLIKFLIGIAVVVAFVWFGANVRLGSRTLFEHLQAIGRTRATQDFVDGTRDSAKPIVDGMRKRLLSPGGAANDPVLPADAGARPTDDISPADRLRLRKVLGSGHPAR